MLLQAILYGEEVNNGYYSPSFVEIEEGLAARFRDPQIIDKQTVDGLIRNR